MNHAPESIYRASYDGDFSVARVSTLPEGELPSKKRSRKNLEEQVERLDELQRCLYAADRHALLLVFQAMDAAGKDSTIRAVMSGVNPAGCQVFAFKRPSARELDHDFLWRSARRLPERGRIGIFNRSYYEEVLVVRVHPEILGHQKLPHDSLKEGFWQARYRSIREHERHLAENGTVILKFWLNVSREEQRRRFLDRLTDPRKHWKFSSGDLEERGHWEAYMDAYQEAIRETSRAWAPWFAIPADDKPAMRVIVAEIIADTLEGLGLSYPHPDPEELENFDSYRERLEAEPDA